MNQDEWSDERVVSEVEAMAGSFLAYAVSNAFCKKDATIRDLRSEVEALRDAIHGVRRFVEVETMTAEQAQGYDLASKDLLLLVSPVLETNWDDLPPLGWGSKGESAAAT